MGFDTLVHDFSRDTFLRSTRTPADPHGSVRVLSFPSTCHLYHQCLKTKITQSIDFKLLV